MRKILLLLLIGIVLLTSCKNSTENNVPSVQVFVVSDGEANNKGTGFFQERTVQVFEVGENLDEWYMETGERRQELREFRNLYEQKKDDFESQKRSEFKNVKAVIDGELIFGYQEGLDMDKSFLESLSEPDTKSDSIYADQAGKGGGFPYKHNFE